jgi:POT family proton-dependent oligopeptide transporter
MTSSAEIAPEKAAPRHPRELYILFATEMWERYGFYTVAGIMTLYLQRGSFNWTKDQATTLWSNYLMFVYATPLVGGWLADKFLGYRRSVLIGGAVFVLGYAMLTLGTLPAFYAALALLFVGNGFFKPNISTMVGNLYPAGSPLRDSAYNIFYMGINIGAFLAPLSAEALLQGLVPREIYEAAQKGLAISAADQATLNRGFLAAFGAASLGMLLGTAIFSLYYRRLADAERRRPGTADGQAAAVTEDLAPGPEKSALELVPEWKRIGALVVIFTIVIVFWMSFHQNGSTMTYWADENTDWKVSGVISNSINPFWIIVLSIPLVKFWGFLNKRGLEPSTPTKMALGMFLTFVSFMILFVAAKYGGGDQTFLTDSAGNLLRDKDGVLQVEQHKVSPLWLITAYAVLSLGELMLSPMGLSLVSKVAPERMRGLLMGGWFVATAIGNKLTMIGLLWTRWHHSSFWLLVALLALAMSLLLAALIRPLKRAMPGV